MLLENALYNTTSHSGGTNSILLGMRAAKFIIIVSCWLLFTVSASFATTHVVLPNGAGVIPTIQDAIDVCVDGDVVELADGTFTGEGNRDLDFSGKAITVCSQNGDPEACIIDCEGSVSSPHRGFWFHSAEAATSILRGIKIINGYVEDYGGGILCDVDADDISASPTIESCILTGNTAPVGAGIALLSTVEAEGTNYAHLIDCDFNYNHGSGATWYDMAIPYYVVDCDFNWNDGSGAEILGDGNFSWSGEQVTNCFFVGNGDAGFYHNTENGGTRFYDCTFAENTGWGVYSHPEEDGGLYLTDCHIHDNQAGGLLMRWYYRETTGCNIFNNGGHGVSALTDFAPKISDCTVRENTGSGIYFGWQIDRPRASESFPGREFDISNCDISYNDMHGILCETGVSMGVIGCSLIGNGLDGIHIDAEWNWPDFFYTITSCTIAYNLGAGMVYDTIIPCYVNETIIAFNGTESLQATQADDLTITCCDFYGNGAGDWAGVIADQVHVRGNFSADPCFCDPLMEDYHLCADSWCLPGNHPWGCDDLVGAFGDGCVECSCNGLVPNQISRFHARSEFGSVTISWHSLPDVELEFQLRASSGDLQWLVPLTVNSSGHCTAVDESAELRSGGQFIYTLYSRTRAQDWAWIWSEQVSLQPTQAVTGLSKVFPNPFNPTTTIDYSLASEQRAELTIYSVDGRKVTTLVSETTPAGKHSVVWNGRDSNHRQVPSGTYFLCLEVGDFAETRRIALIR